MEEDRKRRREWSYDKGNNIKGNGMMMRQKRRREEKDKEKARDEEVAPHK